MENLGEQSVDELGRREFGEVVQLLAHRDVPHGDAERLPFDDAAFDAVISECSFGTFPNKAVVAAEMARVLRPGVRLGLTDMMGSFHLTADGFVIRTEDGEWERYKNSDKLADSLKAPSNTEYYEEAFSLGGEFYYLLDKAAKRLYKLKTWW